MNTSGGSKNDSERLNYVGEKMESGPRRVSDPSARVVKKWINFEWARMVDNLLVN